MKLFILQNIEIRALEKIMQPTIDMGEQSVGRWDTIPKQTLKLKVSW